MTGKQTFFHKCSLTVLTLFILCIAVSAHAGVVRVSVDNPDNDSPAKLQARAQNAGFAEAVYREALTLLPGSLDPVRAELLKEFLKDSAKTYVRSYSEVGQTLTADGMDMTLDVTIDRNALRKELQRIGVFYTVTTPLQCSLSFTGPPGEYWEEVGKLQRLTGLAIEMNAELKLALNVTAEGYWTAILTGPGVHLEEGGKELRPVWTRLWARYFSGEKKAREGLKDVVLEVSGWSSPDGVQAFDGLLGSWEKAVEQSELLGLDIQPMGILARWKVKTYNLSELESLLGDYLSPRQLDFELVGGEQPVEQPEDASKGITDFLNPKNW